MNYFKQPGQSSTVLSCYDNGGNRSGDMVLEYERLDAAGQFWTPVMEMGNAMEALLQDMSTGSEMFDAGFFISDVDNVSVSESKGKRSHAAEIMWTVENWEGDVEARLLELIESRTTTDPKTKKKADYKNAVNSNELARECIANPGRLPITQSDFKSIKTLANRIMDMPLPEWWWGMRNWTIGDVLEHKDAKWQEEIYWEAYPANSENSVTNVDVHNNHAAEFNYSGIEKKAMTDCLLVYKGTAGIIDLKWTAALANFEKRLRGGKWIQAVHYEAAVRAKCDVEVLPMLYVIGIAGGKSEPPLVTARAIEDGPHIRSGRCFCGDCRRAKYEEISLAYHQWEIEGRKPSGFLEGKQVRIWV